MDPAPLPHPLGVELDGDPSPPRRPPSPPPAEQNGLVLKMPPEEEEEEEKKKEGDGLRREEGARGGGRAEGEGGRGGGGGKFTGLGKEELLELAGTPPWVRTRRFLLLLFWVGWGGMLGGAAAIVAKAPRCRPLPHTPWWRLGGLYRAPPKAFGGDLRGVAGHLDHVASLGVRGLILGPLHPQIPGGGDPRAPPLDQLDPELGGLGDFQELLEAAKRNGLRVLVDLTPTPSSGPVWGGPEVASDPKLHNSLKQALNLWLERGAGGVFLDAIEELQPSVVAECRNLTRQRGAERVLVGGTRLLDPPSLLGLLNSSAGGGAAGGEGPVLGPFLEALGPQPPPSSLASQLLQFLEPGVPLVWSVGSPQRHLAGLSPPRAPQRLLLLWAALPGTPALSYGDEVGLGETPGDPQQPPPMPWEKIQEMGEGNSTQEQRLRLCRLLSSLRSRERSLLLGESEAVTVGSSVAFLRSWDRSDRFLVLLNPGEQPLSPPSPLDPQVPPKATLRLSTHRPDLHGAQVELGSLELLPYEGVLLSFPHEA